MYLAVEDEAAINDAEHDVYTYQDLIREDK
jgi:hypothetical protein